MITREEVQKIARLAKLKFSDSDLEKFQKQLGNILDFFEQLKEVDTKDIEETSQVTGLQNVSAVDEVEICEHIDPLLKCTPQKLENHSIKIPKIM